MADQLAAYPIPLTKLAPPQPAENALNRPALTDALYRAVTSRRLTLISAPAGAGKTSAVVALHAAHPEPALAWAALDEGDDDPAAFLQVLIAAVQRQVADFGRTTLPILTAGQAPNFLRLTAVLINDLAVRSDPLVIVLDDLHRIDDATVHKMLDYLLERLPPHIHLVVTTRHDPPLRLAQLRARGHLAEFRLGDLRFAPDEIAALFRDAIGVPLSAADLDLIQARTEGWAAGLRLVSLSLARLDSAEKRTSRLRQLAGSQRFLFDYLVEEVLDQLSADDRRFLLQTAILDELTPDLCNAVTQRHDAGPRLASLYRRNLFLTVSDVADPQAAPTYRYHALFAQFLRKQLHQQPDADAAALHRRAAAAATTVERQIHHLLAAAAWDEAAAALIAVGKAQCNRQFVRPQLIDWLARLPQPVRARHYWFDLIETSYLQQQGRFAEAEAQARRAYPEAEAASDVEGQLVALWTLALWSPGEREPAWQARLQALMSAHPEAVSAERRIFLIAGRVWAAINSHDYAAAAEPMRAYYAMLHAEPALQASYAAGQHIGPQWLFVDDGMALVAQGDATILRRSGDGDGVPQAGVYARQAWRALLRGDLARAAALGARAADIAAQFGSFAFLDSMAGWVRAGVLLARAQYADLTALVQAFEQAAQESDARRRSMPFFWMALWRAHWLQDETAQADALAAHIEAAVSDETRATSCVMGVLAGWRAYAAGQLPEAEAALRDGVRRFRSAPWVGTWGHPQLDLALFYLLQRQPQTALAVWREAAAALQARGMPGLPLLTGRKVIPLLELAQREGVYAEVAQVALDGFGVSAEPQPLPIPGRDEALTPREVEVLQLLLTGASNRDIAAKLVITTRTAKAHVSNILAKLGVGSRTEAVARAHELSLL